MLQIPIQTGTPTISAISVTSPYLKSLRVEMNAFCTLLGLVNRAPISLPHRDTGELQPESGVALCQALTAK